MDTRYLTYILTIAEERNMTRAAKKLYVSQSSLSQYLTRLEQELGTPLFLRTRGELVLTPAGELYAQAAKKVLGIKKQLCKDIAALDHRGHITVGVTSQFGLAVLTEVIPRFNAIFPDYRIEITEQGLPSLTRLLLEESLDLGLIAANSVSPFSPGQTDLLRREEVLFAVCSSHPHNGNGEDSPPLSGGSAQKNPPGILSRRDLKTVFGGENFLLSRQGSTLRVLTDQLFEELDFSPSAVCETNSVLANLGMTARGIGVTFIGESCKNSAEPVTYYSLDPPLSRLNLLVRRKNWRLNEAEEYFCTLIREHFSAKI